MDHKRDYYVHQISIRPKVDNQYSALTFILQANCKYGAQTAEQVLDNSLVSTSLNTSLMGMSQLVKNEKRHLDTSIKNKLSEFFRSLLPCFEQHFAITREFQPQIEDLQQKVSKNELKYEIQRDL